MSDLMLVALGIAFQQMAIAEHLRVPWTRMLPAYFVCGLLWLVNHF